MGGEGRLRKQASTLTSADIPQIVKELKSQPHNAKEKTSHLLDILGHQQKEKAPAAMVSAGAITPLVGLVATGNDGAQIHAASTLATIAANSREYQVKIINAGAINPLVTLVRMGSHRAQTFAAAAIASLSEARKHQEPIIKAGAIQPLVRLVRGGITVDAQEHAADAIANLSAQNPDAQSAFYAAGAIPLLLALLHGGKAQNAAAEALAKLLSPQKAGAPANNEVQAQIFNGGGVAPLLALLSSMNTQAQVHAAEALSNLANGNRLTQEAIAKAGGVGPLLAMLTSKNTMAQAQAASALAQLACNHRENQDSIERNGGIPPLVALLTNSELLVQAMAAFAISEVCRENTHNQTVAANCGCISSLVTLVRGGPSVPGIEEVKAEAAGAIWVLSEAHPDNKIAIAKAGGIPPTVNLLKEGNEKAQLHSANALASLSYANIENQTQITTLLVNLLSSGSDATKANATASLSRLVQENPSSQDEIAKAGPMSDLIVLLKEGTTGAKAFALWSLSRAITPDNQKSILEEDAVKHLVASLASPTTITRQEAAAAISRLVLNSKKAQVEVQKAGGLQPLIQIVNGQIPDQLLDAEAVEALPQTLGDNMVGSDEASQQELEQAKVFAASALSELANIIKNGDEIVRLAGIAPLVQLLNKGDSMGMKHAAAALARLAAGSLDAGKRQTAIDIGNAGAIEPLVSLLDGKCGDEAQEESANALYALAGDDGNRRKITDASGIAPLVSLLGSTNDNARQHAKGAIVRLSNESDNRALIIKKLVDMLGDKEQLAQEEAAAALANLASDSAENRVSIVDAGGIDLLLSLLEGGSSKAKENSMSAISKLAYNSESIQSAIAQAGGIPLLVNALSSISNAKEMMASAQLCSLAALALSQLAKGNQENQAAIANAGAITSLVSMLGAPIPELQANAADCLCNLSTSNLENQSAIARTGAIAPLCTLVREGVDLAKEQSAAALWSLSKDNAQNKSTVAKLGGIEPLVTLLVTGTTENSFEQATGALSSLCQKHAENREAIAKLMVSKLSSRTAMMQTTEGAVRVLSAVSSMCAGSNFNQAAIAKAGGVPPLIMWLSGTLEGGTKANANADAQAAAAVALLGMVTGNDALQALIARSNGIPPLIDLLSKGSVETHAAAARLLWHLSGNAESGTAIVTAGGIRPMCTMLLSEDVHSQELAAVVLTRLLKSNPSACMTVSSEGGIAALVKLLQIGSPAGQQQAACGLVEVGAVPQNRAPIAEAGGIESLVGLLTSNVIGTPETAALALGILARDGQTMQTDGDSETYRDNVDEGLAASGHERRQKIAQAGGIKQLIKMLGAISHKSDFISRKMWELVEKVIGAQDRQANKDAQGHGRREGVTGMASFMEDAGILGAQEQAAASLSELVYGDATMQRQIIESDAVAPLLSLLRNGSQVAQENAARAIWCLCANPDCQSLVVEQGVISDLISLSRNGSVLAQERSAAVLSSLAKGATDMHEEAEIQPLTASDTDSISAIVAAGGIVCLVALATSGNEMTKEHAASALMHIISSNTAHRDTIAKAGGIPPLVQLIEDGNAKSYEYALAALNRLAYNSPENQILIAKKLVTLLAIQNEETQRRSANVLWELAVNNPDAPLRIVNAGAISPLVVLLGSTSSDVKEAAVLALSRLAEKNSSTQLAIATGIATMTGQGGGTGADAQDQITMIANKFATAPDMRLAIAEASMPVSDGGSNLDGLVPKAARRRKSMAPSARRISTDLALLALERIAEDVGPPAETKPDDPAPPKSDVSTTVSPSSNRPTKRSGSGSLARVPNLSPPDAKSPTSPLTPPQKKSWSATAPLVSDRSKKKVSPNSKRGQLSQRSAPSSQRTSSSRG